MKLATFRHDDSTRIGVVDGEEVVWWLSPVAHC